MFLLKGDAIATTVSSDVEVLSVNVRLGQHSVGQDDMGCMYVVVACVYGFVLSYLSSNCHVITSPESRSSTALALSLNGDLFVQNLKPRSWCVVVCLSALSRK